MSRENMQSAQAHNVKDYRMDRQREFREAYEKLETWLEQKDLSPKLQRELNNLIERLERDSGDKDAKEEILDRFHKDLEFGTAGLRGILGAGSNRMNLYTVRRATQGFANYLNRGFRSSGSEKSMPSVAIAYDSRIHSDRFALETAGVFMANGIKVYLYPELMPTPALSFAVRHYGCEGGVMITASHNPAKYNGYKAYNRQGCQINEQQAAVILEEIQKVDLFKGVKSEPVDWEHCAEGQLTNFDGTVMLEMIPEEVTNLYLQDVLNRRVGVSCGCLDVTYTPLNGAGNRCVRKVMEQIGVGRVHIVKEQEKPDGNFPTCPYPNPEKKEALRKGLELCEELGTPDLLIATDPDSDRVGIAAAVFDCERGRKTYHLLTGNEVGVLLLDFICMKRKLPDRPVAIRTIVSSKMVDAVAEKYGVEMRQVLTGFKNIGEQIELLEQAGESQRFIFGYEESYGYLSAPTVRDKDAVDASMLICEMTAWYKQQGRTLFDRLQELYEETGYYKNDVEEFVFEGSLGMNTMNQIMDQFREELPRRVCGRLVSETTDYRTSVRKSADGTECTVDLPKSNVFEVIMEDGSSFMARPSGTEPKLKVYLAARDCSAEASEKRIGDLRREVKGWIRAWTK